MFESEERNDFSITLLGVLIELILIVSIVQLFTFLTETDFNAAYAGILKLLNIDEISGVQAIFLLGTIFVAIGITAVFYVSVGFASYLNRRTVMEGWDLELGFKKIVGRLGVAVLAMLLLIPAADVSAKTEPEDSTTVLKEILDRPEFNQSHDHQCARTHARFNTESPPG